jgi:predicted metalloprotease
MKWRGRRQSDNVETDEECHQSGKTIVGGGLGIVILLLNVFGENGQMVSILETQGKQSAPTEQRDLTEKN